MTELFNNYFYEIAVALGFVLFLLMRRLKNYFYQKRFKESLKKYYCKKRKYNVKVQKFVKFTRKLTKKYREKIKELNEELKWAKFYRDKYYKEITKFRDEIFKTKEVQDAINQYKNRTEFGIRREAERKIEEFKEQKYLEDCIAIEKIVKIKNLDERFKLIVYQKKDNDFLRYSFLREILLTLKQCEDENEGVKAELNLQVSANYLLVKEIEELKKPTK